MIAAPQRAWSLASTGFVAGGVAVAGFAPLGFAPLTVAALAVLAWLGNESPSARAAGYAGYGFGLGLFAFGIPWIYIALHVFGAMPPALAVLATAIFAAFLALYPALALYAAKRLAPASWSIAFAATWTLSEWLRGWVFTGFPWLAMGYSQTPWSPLAGYAPVLGVYGVTLATAATGAALAVLVTGGSRRNSLVALIALVGGGGALGWVPWTQTAGQPIEVSLIQGNVAQEAKFRAESLTETLRLFDRLVSETRSPLVILPETAFPMLLNDLPRDYLDHLAAQMQRRGGDLIAGVFENDPIGSDRYFNAAISLGTSPRQHYRKVHLVPFGEFIPLKPLLAPFINEVLRIPLSDQTRGAENQQPIDVAGQKVAIDICYEDAFGEEIIRQLPAATMLVNLTNDAWYGESWASEQHLQMSQTRALETGRTMLRATNTGRTAAIDHRGRVLNVLPEFEQAVLTYVVTGRTGATPFVQFGNTPVVVLAFTLLLVAMRLR